jgi:hypothetical protein
MQDKNKAIATLDVRIIGAQAEQRRRLERRVHRITRLYPDLRRVPLEVREDLAIEASKNALRSWPAYVLGLLMAVAIVAPFYAPARTISGLNAFELFVAALILTAIPGVAFYLRIRAHVKRTVESRYANSNALPGA